MRHIRRILVALRQDQGRTSPALQKAARLARGFDAELEIFHDLETPLCIDQFTDPVDLRRSQRAMREHAQRWLDALAAPLTAQGLAVTTRVEWDFPAYEAIIRRARRIGADLVVVDCHRQHHLAPSLLRLNDWELLQKSPVPVLLVKSPGTYAGPVIMAAVDPSHALAKPSRLDGEILSIAAAIARTARGTLHAVHAFSPILVPVPPAEYLKEDFARRMEDKARERARKGFERVLRDANLPKTRQHLLMEHAIDAIPRQAAKLHCDIVVMGAVSRSGLKRIFIGNTAERLLDKIGCDLLVVKPLGFRNRVDRRSRGAHLVVAPPALAP